MRRLMFLGATAMGSVALMSGALTIFSDPVIADLAGTCSSQGVSPSCTIEKTIVTPASVMIVLNSQPFGQRTTVAWTAICTLGGKTVTTKGGLAGSTPVTDQVMLGFRSPDACAISASGGITGSGTFILTLKFKPQGGPVPSPSATGAQSLTPSPAPTPVPVPEIRGFAGMCADDTGNAAVAGSRIQIWGCLNDPAQSWVFANGELIHAGMCANDSGWGGNLSHVILWRCNGAANERWIHFGGRYVLVANGARLCLDDPAFSTRDGTQLIVYRCNAGANQQWTSPTVDR